MLAEKAFVCVDVGHLFDDFMVKCRSCAFSVLGSVVVTLQIH